MWGNSDPLSVHISEELLLTRLLSALLYKMCLLAVRLTYWRGKTPYHYLGIHSESHVQLLAPAYSFYFLALKIIQDHFSNAWVRHLFKKRKPMYFGSPPTVIQNKRRKGFSYNHIVALSLLNKWLPLSILCGFLFHQRPISWWTFLNSGLYSWV